MSGNDSVKVDTDALRTYGADLTTAGLAHSTDVTQALSLVVPLAQVLTAPTSAGAFAEGAVIAGQMMQSTADFNAFMKDMTTGVRYIGSAATVIATGYASHDANSANDINLVDFAFGDYTAKTPPGMKGYQTWTDKAMQDAANAPQPSYAQLGLTDPTFIQSNFDDGVYQVIQYKDGSQLIIHNGVSTVQGVDGSTQTTTITDGHDKTLSSDTKTYGTDSHGNKVVVTSTNQGGGEIVRSVTTDKSTGAITITTTAPGQAPVTVTSPADPAHQGTPDHGPMQQQLDQEPPPTVDDPGTGYSW
jgi:hypothetical protein